MKLPLSVAGKDCYCDECGSVIEIEDANDVAVVHVLFGPQWATHNLRTTEEQARAIAEKIVAAINHLR
jgi:hypothetical protein